MAHHLSAKKRIRQSAKRRLQNRYHSKTMRNAVRNLRALKDKKEADAQLPAVISKLDKLVKSNQIHKNKASNLKSKLTKFVNALGVVVAEKTVKKAATKGAGKSAGKGAVAAAKKKK
jgi:small subunit ribosomal protein S20